MSGRGLIVAAPRSGAGKTVITLALLAALRRRGIAVKAAKTGPDYIDPGFHAAATGAAGCNLDSWAMPPALLDALVAEASSDAEILVIEGVMGLFDGVAGSPGRCGTTADLAARFALPVVLVLDVAGQSQSAAAVLRGFASHDPAVRIAGVILNRVGSERHRALVSEAIAALRRRRFRFSVPFRAPPRWSCPSAISAWCRPASMLISTAGSIASPTWRNSTSISMPCWPPRRHSAIPRSAPDRRAAAARPAHRARARSGLQLRLSACARRLAARRGRDRGLLAARRRAAAGELRCRLAARRISGAACRRARGCGPVSCRTGAVCADPAGPWRMRRLHGAGPRPHRRAGGAPRHDGTARACDQLRAAQAAARLSGGAAARRQPASDQPAARCAATSSIMRP